MDKPEWCSEEIWNDAMQVAMPLPIGELGQKTLAREVAKAILSTQSQAYIDAARIAEKHGEKWGADGVQGWIVARDIEEDILQRKEEIGRN